MAFIKRGDGKILTVITTDKELSEEQKEAMQKKLSEEKDNSKKEND